MNFFVFIVLIPVLTGLITAACGVSYFNPETLKMAIAINVPICVLSASVYHFTS